jgi:hypothetical protein
MHLQCADKELGNGHSGIGVCLALQGKASEAVEHFEAAKSARRFDPPSSGVCTLNDSVCMTLVLYAWHTSWVVTAVCDTCCM